MPTYEYECKSCGHNFEVFQSMSDEPLKECPKCSKEIRRLIFGGTGVIFKGSGFYVTDKGKSGGKKDKPASGEAAKGGSSEKSSGETSSANAPDSKPAADSSSVSGKNGAATDGKSNTDSKTLKQK